MLKLKGFGRKIRIDFLISYNGIKWNKINILYAFLIAIGCKTLHKRASEIKLNVIALLRTECHVLSHNNL